MTVDGEQQCPLCRGGRLTQHLKAVLPSAQRRAETYRCTSAEHGYHPDILRCQDCRFVFLKERPAPEDLPKLSHARRHLLDVGAYTGVAVEVARDAAVLVDPTDVAAMASAMRRVVEDRELREELRRRRALRAKAYSWEQSARDLLRVYPDLMQDKAA